MKALLSLVIMGLVFTSAPAVFAKEKHKSHKAATKANKPHDKKGKKTEMAPAEEPAPTEAPAEDGSAE